MERPGRNVAPCRDGVAVGPAGEEQESEEQRRSARLAEPERHPAGTSLGLVASAAPDQDEERDGQRFPRE